jgi:hypothetical protein
MKKIVAIEALIVFLAPIVPLVILTGAFIIADTLLGIYKAKKIKQKVTSRRLSDIIPKLIGYTGLILLTFGLDHYIVGEFIKEYISIEYAATKVVAFILIAIEAYSMDESLREFNDGKGVKHYFTQIVKTVKRIKKDVIDIKSKD